MEDRTMNKALLIALAVSTVSCGQRSEEQRYDAGWNDGHASGYNTTCKIRATLVEGDWENREYSRGYNDGYSEGTRECLTGIERLQDIP
jgi:hypothetical protein